MTKVDIASMAHGLECRQPFLDHRLVELAARMPVDLKYRRRRGQANSLGNFFRHNPSADCASQKDWIWRSLGRLVSRSLGRAFELGSFGPESTRQRFLPPGKRATAARRSPAIPLRPQLPPVVAVGAGTLVASLGGLMQCGLWLGSRAFRIGFYRREGRKRRRGGECSRSMISDQCGLGLA